RNPDNGLCILDSARRTGINAKIKYRAVGPGHQIIEIALNCIFLLINLISSRQCHCFHDRSPPSHAVHLFVHELGEVVTGNAIFGRSAWIAFIPTITAFVATNHPLYKRLIVCKSHGLHQSPSLSRTTSPSRPSPTRPASKLRLLTRSSLSV